MNRTGGMAALLATLLEPQLETGRFGEIDRYRLIEALTCGPSLTTAEQSLLLLSPIARQDYKQVRQEVREGLNTRLREHGVELELLPLAAASEGSDQKKIVMRGKGFSVTLYRQEELGIPWVILVQLGPAYLRTVNPMTVLRLFDSGGLEWLRGRPDVHGEITSTWNDPHTDLLARSKRFSLCLEPV